MKTEKRAYRRMQGIKYGNKVDYPRKCEKCGAGTAHMNRHGYLDTCDHEFKYKRFLCKQCGKVMIRLSGYVAPTTV